MSGEGKTSIVAIVLSVTWLFAPFAIWTDYYSETVYNGGNPIYRIGVSLFAPIWRWSPDQFSENPGFQFLDWPVLTFALLFALPTLLFAYQVFGYCSGRTSWEITLFSGIVSYVPAILKEVFVYQWLSQTGITQYLGPFPFLFVVALLMMKWAKPEEMKSPWDGLETDT
jgi:hypothetical protein